MRKKLKDSDDVKVKQLELFKKIKKIQNFYQDKLFKPFYDSPIYFTPLDENIFSDLNLGNKIFKPKGLIFKFYFILKNILYSIFFDQKIFKNKISENNDKLILTWAFKNNFSKDGSLNDRYLNINSKNCPGITWFVIYMDQTLPNKIGEDIILFRSVNKNKIKFLNPLKILFKNFKYLFIDLKYFLFSISKYNNFSYIFNKTFLNCLNYGTEKILIHYEGQPFQNELIRNIKRLNKKIEIIGNMHAPPLPFPSPYIKKKFTPDKIIVNGKLQTQFFIKNGWNKKNIFLKNSYRYLNSKYNLKKTVYLPIMIKSEKKIIESIKYLSYNTYNLNGYKIKLHPASKNISSFQIFKKKINFIINSKNRRKSEKLTSPIYIGATGGIIEALEKGYQVIHICENPVLDLYSDKIWTNIISKKITENIFIYKIKNKGQILKFGKRQKNLDKIFKLK